MEIQILPHHIGIFTDFYISNAKEREERLIPTRNYKEVFNSNMGDIFYKILIDPNTMIEVVFSKPDSICLPDKNEYCKKCIDGKLEPYPERFSNDKEYREFIRATEILGEMKNLLFYPTLEPRRNYTQEYFMEAVEGTAQKIKEIYKHKVPYGGYTPYSLGYLPNYKEILKRYFPLVLEFDKTEMFDQIHGRYLSERIIHGRIVSNKEIKDLMEKYPIMFSGDSKEIYHNILQLLDRKKIVSGNQLQLNRCWRPR